jgi:carbamate kinase
MGKKRYQLSLDKASVEQLQYYMKELGMPAGSLSAMINAALPTMVNIYAQMYQKRQIGGVSGHLRGGSESCTR